MVEDPNLQAGSIIATPPSPAVGDAATATALLANRAPIAGLGYDPRRTTFNDSPFRLSGAVGLYRPQGDQMYVDESSSKGTGVHEAVHRGLEELRRNGSALARGVTPQQEEAISRFVEQSLMGTKTQRGSGPDYDQGAGVWQRDPKVLELIGALNREAAALGAKKRPRGPR
jgi:hypothetical protein